MCRVKRDSFKAPNGALMGQQNNVLVERPVVRGFLSDSMKNNTSDEPTLVLSSHKYAIVNTPISPKLLQIVIVVTCDKRVNLNLKRERDIGVG